jgi:hypothetical protein
MSLARHSILLRNASLFDDPQYGRLAHGKLVKTAHSRRSQEGIDVEFRVRNGADMRLLLREQRALTTRAAHTIIVPRAIQGGPERSWSTQCSSTE